MSLDPLHQLRDRPRQNNNIEILLTGHGIERPLFQALYSSSKFFYVTASGEWQILQYCEAFFAFLLFSLLILRNRLFWRFHGIHYDTIFAIPHRYRHTVCLQEKEGKMVSIGPLQLAIHVVQNCHAGEQQSYWDMINKRHA